MGHHFTRNEASAAGKVGGAKISADRGHMASIGRTGGRSTSPRKQAASRANIARVNRVFQYVADEIVAGPAAAAYPASLEPAGA